MAYRVRPRGSRLDLHLESDYYPIFSDVYHSFYVSHSVCDSHALTLESHVAGVAVHGRAAVWCSEPGAVRLGRDDLVCRRARGHAGDDEAHQECRLTAGYVIASISL